MSDFKKYITDVQSVNGILAKGALIAPPAAAGFSAISPPWPSNGPVIIGFFISMLHLVAAYYLFSVGGSISSKFDRLIKFSVCGIVISLFLYLVLFNFFAFVVGSTGTYDVSGFLFQSENFKNYDIIWVLKSNGWDPLLVWVPWTVYLTRITLLFSWIFVFVFTSSFFSLFYIKSQSQDNPQGNPSPEGNSNAQTAP